MKKLMDYLETEHNIDINNIRFKGDDIILLGDTLTLGTNEAIADGGNISTGMNERFQKLN